MDVLAPPCRALNRAAIKARRCSCPDFVRIIRDRVSVPILNDAANLHWLRVGHWNRLRQYPYRTGRLLTLACRLL